MGLVNYVKKRVETSAWLLELKFAALRPLHFVSYVLKQDANERAIVHGAASQVMASPEYELIPKHPDAGKVKGGRLVMHNGTRVLPTCYLGWPNYVMLRGTGGVHEPEEERVFLDVLKTMPAGAVMLELGAYWAFYSLWFQSAVPDAKSFLVEPQLSHLNYGKKNFRINGRHGVFIHAFVGDVESSGNGQATVTVDSVMAQHDIRAIDVVHADVQGFELDMLRGARHALENGRVRWFFISTHSHDLHRDCREFLADRGFVVVAEAIQGQISGPDGVLVMRHERVPDPGIAPIRLAAGRAAQPF